MHPILAKKSRLLLYLGAWVPVAFLVAALVAFAERPPWKEALALVMPLCLFYALPCLAAWYLCRIFPLESPGLLRTLSVLTFAAALSASLWLLAGGVWANLLARTAKFDGAAELFRRSSPLLLAAAAALFFLSVAAGYLLAAAEESQKAQRLAFELKMLAKEAELRALKAQIDPHFLFNSLNSILALIGSEPEEARRMCLLLADFLRKSLKTAASESIPLAEELSLLECFLDIERIRFGTRLEVEYDVEEDSMSCPVPPLLLQPLMENAINHGIAHMIEGGRISVRAAKSASGLLIRVANPADPDRTRSGKRGIGLNNVHSRLAAVYGNNARLDTTEKEGMFSAEIRMPC